MKHESIILLFYSLKMGKGNESYPINMSANASANMLATIFLHIIYQGYLLCQGCSGGESVACWWCMNFYSIFYDLCILSL